MTVKKKTTSSPPQSPPPPPHSACRSGGGGGTALVVVVRRVRFRVTWPRKIYSRGVVSTPSRRVLYIISEEQLTFRSAAANIWRVRSTTSLAQRLSAPFVGVFSAPPLPRNNRQFSILSVRRPTYQSTHALCMYIQIKNAQSSSGGGGRVVPVVRRPRTRRWWFIPCWLARAAYMLTHTRARNGHRSESNAHVDARRQAASDFHVNFLPAA